MIIVNKYNNSALMSLNNFIELNTTHKNNAFRIKSLFNHSKRLIRALLLVHFYIYSVFPFSPILYRGTARYHIKLNSIIFVLVNGKCLESYFRD